MNTKIHICLLTSARVFERAYGGEERFTILLANWLAAHEKEVTLMGSTFAGIKTEHISNYDLGNRNKKKEKAGNKKTRTLNLPHFVFFLSRLVISFLWIFKILLINKKYPMTLIHAQDTGYSGLAAIIAGRILKIPVVITSHGIRHKTLETSIQGRLKKILLNFEYRLDLFSISHADGLIVVNRSIGDYFKEIAVLKRGAEIIPIPINIKNFEFSGAKRDTMRNELGIGEKTKVIGFVGRFSPEKNLLTLLISFANVARDDSSIKLMLVGTGPEEPKLKEFVSRNDIEDRVIFCGVRYDINMLLSAFDIFVLPSYVEGFSTALLEAMASGRPIICSNIAANRELVTHNKEALMVNPHNVNELNHAIQILIKDDSLGISLGTNARNKATHYDEHEILPKVTQYYKLILAQRNERTYEN